MAEGGRHLNGNNNGDMDRYDEHMQWPDLDWLEETPEPERPAPRQSRAQRPAQPQAQRRPAQQRPAQQCPAQQRPAQPRQQQPARQGGAPQSRPQRPAQPQGQQRPAQQRPAQQRPAQPRQQQRPVQQRPQQPVPRRQAAQERRFVEVEPEEYRPKRRRRSSVPLIILIVVLVGGILFAGVKLGTALLNYHRDSTAYSNLSDEVLSGLAEPNATHDPSQQDDPNAGQQQVQSEAPFAVNWDYLKSVNSDVVGWIYCADTRINYPVVQTSDNDYYLHRDFTTRQPNTVGTLFVDYNSALGVNLSNYLIYGHNMKDGSMFATLQHYVDQSYYDQHPVMYFLTPNQNYRIDLIAARIVESSQDNYPSYFQDESAYANYQGVITSHSYFATRATVTTGYQMISLSTCDYSGGFNDPRFLVQGLLVPIQ